MPGFPPDDPRDRLRVQRLERGGLPFLVYWMPGDELAVLALDAATGPVVLGRRAGKGVALEWDERVSRSHALIEPAGDDWVLVDNGSTNGSFVDGRRVTARVRLLDRQRIRVGQTEIWFRQPSNHGSIPTVHSDLTPASDRITPAQQRVLTALCAPSIEQGELATPPTNQQISDDLFLSVDAIKAHLRELFRLFEISDMPQNQKRLRLVELATRSGAVS